LAEREITFKIFAAPTAVLTMPWPNPAAELTKPLPAVSAPQTARRFAGARLLIVVVLHLLPPTPVPDEPGPVVLVGMLEAWLDSAKPAQLRAMTKLVESSEMTPRPARTLPLLSSSKKELQSDSMGLKSPYTLQQRGHPDTHLQAVNHFRLTF
jgi:hypothetical protein